MTSPSCPVSTRPPLPAMDAASTKRTSPPAPVTASPVATPGTLVRAATYWWNFGRPSASVTPAVSITTGVGCPPAAMRVAALRSTVPSSRSN